MAEATLLSVSAFEIVDQLSKQARGHDALLSFVPEGASARGGTAVAQGARRELTWPLMSSKPSRRERKREVG